MEEMRQRIDRADKEKEINEAIQVRASADCSTAMTGFLGAQLIRRLGHVRHCQGSRTKTAGAHLKLVAETAIRHLTIAPGGIS